MTPFIVTLISLTVISLWNEEPLSIDAQEWRVSLAMTRRSSCCWKFSKCASLSFTDKLELIESHTTDWVTSQCNWIPVVNCRSQLLVTPLSIFELKGEFYHNSLNYSLSTWFVLRVENSEWLWEWITLWVDIRLITYPSWRLFLTLEDLECKAPPASDTDVQNAVCLALQRFLRQSRRFHGHVWFFFFSLYNSWICTHKDMLCWSRRVEATSFSCHSSSTFKFLYDADVVVLSATDVDVVTEWQSALECVFECKTQCLFHTFSLICRGIVTATSWLYASMWVTWMMYNLSSLSTTDVFMSLLTKQLTDRIWKECLYFSHRSWFAIFYNFLPLITRWVKSCIL